MSKSLPQRSVENRRSISRCALPPRPRRISQLPRQRIDQRLSFADVLKSCGSFLVQNPKECIIMSIQEEFKPASNTRKFDQNVQGLSGRRSQALVARGQNPDLEPSRRKDRFVPALPHQFHAAGPEPRNLGRTTRIFPTPGHPSDWSCRTTMNCRIRARKSPQSSTNTKLPPRAIQTASALISPAAFGQSRPRASQTSSRSKWCSSPGWSLIFKIPLIRETKLPC